VDLPSGVDASTGEVARAAVRAAVTVTFHARKVGLVVGPGRFHAGEVTVAGIGLEPGRTRNALVTRRILEQVPRKRPQDTKYTAGSVLVVGGAPGLTGAACLAAEAALGADGADAARGGARPAARAGVGVGGRAPARGRLASRRAVRVCLPAQGRGHARRRARRGRARRRRGAAFAGRRGHRRRADRRDRGVPGEGDGGAARRRGRSRRLRRGGFARPAARPRRRRRRRAPAGGAPVKALLFDFDGTLVDTEGPAFRSWQEAYAEVGHELPLARWSAAIGTINGFDALANLEELTRGAIDREGVRARRLRRERELVATEALRPGVEHYLRDARAL